MKFPTEIHVFGSLKKSIDGKKKYPLKVDLQKPMPIIEVLKNLKIEPREVQLMMINHRAIPKDASLHPGDRLSLFPREYPIFVDWKDLRSR